MDSARRLQPGTSILVPVYNRVHLIGACVESALDQTVADLEVVICDNASNDGTWDVCRRLAERDPRVRIFQNASNLGPVRNWLRCLDRARGEYAKLLFSDDVIAPTYLESTLPYLAKETTAFAFSQVRVGETPTEASVRFTWHRPSGCYPSRMLTHHLCFTHWLPYSPGCALFRTADMRRNLRLDVPPIGQHDFASLGAGPDALLLLLTAQDYSDVGYVAEPLCFFRAHQDSISVGRRNDAVDEGYARAFAWFARTYLRKTTLWRLLSRQWVREMRKHREYVAPRDLLTRVACDASAIQLLVGFSLETAAHPARRAKRILARRRHPS